MARAQAIEVDVVVVGAGFAGLSAALALKDQGIDCAVLEASQRVGGRSKPGYLMGDSIDLGAQWVTPGQTEIYALAKSFGVETSPQFELGNWQLRKDKKTNAYSHNRSPLGFVAGRDLRTGLEKLERLADQLPNDQYWNIAIAKKWDALSVEAWKRTNFNTKAARQYFDMLVRSCMCAEPSEVSFLHFLGVVRSVGGTHDLLLGQEGFQRENVVGGLHQIAAKLGAQLKDNIHFDSPVHGIDQTGDQIAVYSGKKIYRAHRTIVAVPPVLAGRMVYNPSLPARRDSLTQRFPMGSVIKCFIGFDKPFWRNDGFSGHMIDLDSHLSFAFDATPPHADYGALVAFFVGDSARLWSERSIEERRNIVINRLSKTFGDEALHPMDYVDCDWAAEDWSRGGFSGYMPPGVATTLGEVMRQPCGRIHWASAETSDAWIGHVEGAIRSGKRTAQEVIDWLQSDENFKGKIDTADDAAIVEEVAQPLDATEIPAAEIAQRA